MWKNFLFRSKRFFLKNDNHKNNIVILCAIKQKIAYYSHATIFMISFLHYCTNNIPCENTKNSKIDSKKPFFWMQLYRKFLKSKHFSWKRIITKIKPVQSSYYSCYHNTFAVIPTLPSQQRRPHAVTPTIVITMLPSEHCCLNVAVPMLPSQCTDVVTMLPSQCSHHNVVAPMQQSQCYHPNPVIPMLPFPCCHPNSPNTKKQKVSYTYCTIVVTSLSSICDLILVHDMYYCNKQNT